MANLIYKVKKIKNDFNTALNGKVYAKAVYTETLSFQDFIEHIISHGSVYDRGTVQGIMFQMVDCLKELMLDSKKIWLGDLDVFALALKNKSADDEASFNINDNVVGVRVKFCANKGKAAGLDSKSFRKKAKLMSIDVLNGIKKKKEEEGDGSETGGESGGETGGTEQNP